MTIDSLNSAIRVNQRPVVAREELESLVKAHEQFLARSPHGKRARFVHRNLAGVDLANRNLAEGDFSGAVLYGASLKFANLERANLYCVDMRNVDGRYGNFTSADMRGATLTNGNFSYAKLDHADLRAGRLAEAGSKGIESIVDRNSAASGVDFSYCSLRGASLDRANLGGANFTGAIIHGTTFKGARLANATFEGAVLIDVNLSEMQIPAAVLKTCILPPSDAATANVPHLLAKLEAHQRWVSTNARTGASAVLDDEDLRPLLDSIGKFKLTAISARNVLAIGVDFSGTELQSADFEGADLRGASFEGADLRGVSFRNANLAHAKFMGADMTSLRLNSGAVRASDFTGAKLSSEQLGDAVLDPGAGV